jgi:flagellin-like protein
MPKQNKGISPVISVVILVAIAVVIAGSMSAFASGVFNNYAGSPNVKVLSLEVDGHGRGTINLVNSGAGSDTLEALQVHPNDPVILNSKNHPHNNNNNNGNNGNNGIGSLNDPTPECAEHSEMGNCLHDKDKGKSGESNGHQNENNNSNDGNGNSNGNNGGGSESDTVEHADLLDAVIPANSDKEITWTDDSLGEFSPGQQIVVTITFSSGNELTYYTIVS